MKERLFIAVPIAPDICEEIHQSIDLPENFKVSKAENIHITLLFLGDIVNDQKIKIIKKLEESIKNHSAFKLEISSSGQFPPSGYPKIIYLTGEKGKEKLINIANNIRKNIKLLGIEDNKKFNYHITVARQKYRDNNNITLPKINKTEVNIEKIVLYKSDLSKKGPVYSELWSGNLN